MMMMIYGSQFLTRVVAVKRTQIVNRTAADHFILMMMVVVTDYIIFVVEI